MINTVRFMEEICLERPIGTTNNGKVLDFLSDVAISLNYQVLSLPFMCKVWQQGDSIIQSQAKKDYQVYSSAYSRPFCGNGKILVVKSFAELQHVEECKENILFLEGTIAETPLMPKNFPFYYPQEHKEIIDRLERLNPKAIVCVNEKHPLCGLQPFSIFEDCNFKIPVAYTDILSAKKIKKDGETIYLKIDSTVSMRSSRQLVISNEEVKDKEKIIICAHMDTKYNTPGAVDNATGVAILYKALELLAGSSNNYDIVFVPFNGEEHPEVNGQQIYLQYLKEKHAKIKLVINIDGACFKGSKLAISMYNIDDMLSREIHSLVQGNKKLLIGEQWYAGDHAMFAFQGIPCIVLTSSNLMEEVVAISHTPQDILDNVSYQQIEETSITICQLINLV